MLYCANATKSRLTYKNASGVTRNLVFPPGIEVTIERESRVRNCWRFWGVGAFGQPIQCWASGINPSWGDPINGGTAHPYMDGQALYRNVYTMVFASTLGIERVDTIDGYAEGSNYGTCDSFSSGEGTTCRILVNNGALLNDLILCPGDYQVGCGDDCPPGTCKCPTDSYPGYCCLDCKAVAARLNNMSERLHCD